MPPASPQLQLTLPTPGSGGALCQTGPQLELRGARLPGTGKGGGHFGGGFSGSF